MGKSALRGLVSCVLLFLFPASSFAADAAAAMLYTNGSAWVNGAHVPRSSSAIFSGDLLQTRAGSVANINAAGSSITILSDSLVEFQGESLKVEHGGIAVSTSKSVAATAGDWKITPVSNSWTEFNVIDVDGNVKVAARKGDLTITDGKEVFTLAQGQETTQDESTEQHRKRRKGGAGAAPAAGGGIMNSPYAIGIGAAAIAGVTTWVLIKNDDPVSPQIP